MVLKKNICSTIIPTEGPFSVRSEVFALGWGLTSPVKCRPVKLWLLHLKSSCHPFRVMCLCDVGVNGTPPYRCAITWCEADCRTGRCRLPLASFAWSPPSFNHFPASWLNSPLGCLELNRSLLSSSCCFQTVIDSYIMGLVSFSRIIRSGTYWCNFRSLAQLIDRLLSSVSHYRGLKFLFFPWNIFS